MGKLKTNLLYNMLYQLLILVVPFITTPYVSRVLGAEGIGTYSVTTAIVKYFYLFALLGMSNYGNRTIARARTNKLELSEVFWNLYFFQLIFSSISVCIYLFYLFFFGGDKYGLASVCQLPYILSAVLEISWFFYGTEQFKFMVVRNTIIKVATMISIFLFVKDNNDVHIYIFINAISLLLGQICLWPIILKQVFFIRPRWDKIKAHLKPNLILSVSVIAVSIYTLMDKIMIEMISTRTQVGYYENTEKVMTICNSIVGAIGAVMLPRISYLMGNNDTKSVNKYLEKSMKYIMILAIAISFGLIGISSNFALIFFGNEFAACGKLLRVISLAIIFYSWENILRTQYLLPGNRDSIFVKGTIYAALVNLVLNLIFISRFGALGAVFGTVGAQFMAAVYQTICIRKEITIKKYINNLLPTILIGCIMITLCKIIEYLFKNVIFALILQILVGGFVFVVLEFVHMINSKDEMLYQLINKKKEGKKL